MISECLKRNIFWWKELYITNIYLSWLYRDCEYALNTLTKLFLEIVCPSLE